MADGDGREVGPAHLAALHDHRGLGVEEVQPGHRPAGSGGLGGGDRGAPLPQPAEVEPGATAGAVTSGGQGERLQHAAEVVLDRQHEAGRELTLHGAAVVEDAAARPEAVVRHQGAEAPGPGGRLGVAGAVPALDVTERAGDPVEDLVGGLPRLPPSVPGSRRPSLASNTSGVTACLLRSRQGPGSAGRCGAGVAVTVGRKGGEHDVERLRDGLRLRPAVHGQHVQPQASAAARYSFARPAWNSR